MDYKEVGFWEGPPLVEYPGHRPMGSRIAQDIENVPSVIRPYYSKRVVRVPIRVWADKKFSLIDFLRHTRRATPSKPQEHGR